MQIVGLQLNLAWEDRAENYRRARELLGGAHIERGAMIVLPEMFATGYSMNLAATVEPEDEPTCGFYAELARRHGAHVLGGVVARDPSGRGRNEAVVVGPDGAEVARYCKMRPMRLGPPAGAEPVEETRTSVEAQVRLGAEIDHYCRGEEIVAFAWGPLTVCPLICYDLRFPELFRRGVKAGAEVFIVIASWPDKRHAHWTALLRARAIENQAYVVGVNRCGDDPHHHYAGGSVVFDPHGAAIAELGDQPGLLTATLRHEVVTQWRAAFPALKDL